MTLNDFEQKRKEGGQKFLKNFYATKILSDNDTRDFLILLISKALGLDANIIKEDFELVDIRTGVSKDVKDSEADLVVHSNIGYINIEINYRYSKALAFKNTSYICELTLKQVKPGRKNEYLGIETVTQINIDGYDEYGENRFIYTSTLMEEESLKPRRNSFLKIVDINLDFLRKLSYTDVIKFPNDSLEKMLYFFVNDNREVLDEIYIGDELMEKVKAKLYDLDMDNLDSYLFYDGEALIREGLLEDAKEIVYKEVYDEIHKKGLEQGLEQGRDEEKAKKILEIKTLMKSGVSLDIISKSFDLTDEELEDLKK